MNNLNLIKLEQLMKAKKAISINNKLIKKILGFEDMRDFFKSISDWGYTSDFTYKGYVTEDFQSFLRAYLKQEFLDIK